MDRSGKATLEIEGKNEAMLEENWGAMLEGELSPLKAYFAGLFQGK